MKIIPDVNRHYPPLNKTSFSRPQLLLFALIFAAIGGYVLWRSFAATPAVSQTNIAFGDLNGDNHVDIKDLGILSSDWHTNKAEADINSDGTVDIKDLGVLSGHWHQNLSKPFVGYPNTDEGIHIAQTFNHNTPDTNSLKIVDYIWGANHVTGVPISDLPNTHQDAYIPFELDYDKQDKPNHSLQWWKDNHPDWIVYQSNKLTPAYFGYGTTSYVNNVPLDFSNPQVRAYQIKQALVMLDKGYDGIAWDDFNFTNFEDRRGTYKNSVWTDLGYGAKGAPNPKLREHMVAWVTDIYMQLKALRPDKTITVNHTWLGSGNGPLPEITPYIDADYDEPGFTALRVGHLTDCRLVSGKCINQWQAAVDEFEYLNSHGKAWIASGLTKVCATDAPADCDTVKGGGQSRRLWPAETNWILGNYLLVKGAHSYTYTYGWATPGGKFIDRPEYHIPIGHSTSARYVSQNVQIRNYSGGLVIVNPSATKTYTVSLAQAYKDMYGKPITTSLTLAPASAKVLLNP